MEKTLPQFLLHKINEQYSKDDVYVILDGLKSQKKTTFRVNRLKSSINEIENILNKNNIIYSKVNFWEDIFIIEDRDEKIRSLDIYQDGKIYMQSISSMLPVLFLDPKGKENILDMCAAPGGKTTQIASITNNKAFLTICEKNKIRFDKLKYNLEKQGVRNYNLMREDSRNLNDYFKFDKILLDSPCSGSGTDSVYNESFSEELVNRVVKTQESLLRKALKLVNPGSTIIYSTCSIFKDENEKILEMFKDIIEIIPIEKVKDSRIRFLPSLDGTITVCPTQYYEGFFVAKISKKVKKKVLHF